ncbi:ABC transporter permease [Sediminibacillus albus]|uniref:Putative hemin transport system permease protein HrtB n=1 Tax=Sediminibacillus albus TaxID=407036 RepID=A0A1G8X4Q2_9BACI|nr:FtsX-like permease family protein [Sediminibacillus albus]SDJ85592.1 putative ABC transport system permease protein [Sediminibacillus albus]
MFLAFKELGYSKLKYILVTIILTAILFLLFFVNGLASGLSNADSSSLKNLPADYVVMNEEAEGNITKSQITEAEKQMVYEKVNHDQATPLTITMSTVKQDSRSTDIVYFALNTDRLTMPEVIEGKSVRAISGKEVIVDESIKDQGYSLNDTLKDENLDTEFKIAGFFENQTYSHLPVVYTSLTHWHENELTDQEVSQAVLYDGEKAGFDELEALTIDETVSAMPGYSETQGSLLMMITFLFIISAFVSTVFFYVITIQKTNQFGILKAIGADTKFIAKGMIIQVVLITALSLGLSLLGITGMTKVIPAEMPFEISISLIAFTGALFLALNLTGSLLSVYRAAKVDALEAIGRVE